MHLCSSFYCLLLVLFANSISPTKKQGNKSKVNKPNYCQLTIVLFIQNPSKRNKIITMSPRNNKSNTNNGNSPNDKSPVKKNGFSSTQKSSSIPLVVSSRNFSTNKQSMLKHLAMVLLFLMQRRPTKVKSREVTLLMPMMLPSWESLTLMGFHLS